MTEKKAEWVDKMSALKDKYTNKEISLEEYNRIAEEYLIQLESILSEEK